MLALRTGLPRTPIGPPVSPPAALLRNPRAYRHACGGKPGRGRGESRRVWLAGVGRWCGLGRAGGTGGHACRPRELWPRSAEPGRRAPYGLVSVSLGRPRPAAAQRPPSRPPAVPPFLGRPGVDGPWGELQGRLVGLSCGWGVLAAFLVALRCSVMLRLLTWGRGEAAPPTKRGILDPPLQHPAVAVFFCIRRLPKHARSRKAFRAPLHFFRLRKTP